MRSVNPSDRDLAFGRPARPPATIFGVCPRMHWRSVNPALPPPDARGCPRREPDCCATSAAVDLRRVA